MDPMSARHAPTTPRSHPPGQGPTSVDILSASISVDVVGDRQEEEVDDRYHPRYGTQRHPPDVTLKEAADLLGVLPDTLRQAINATPPRLNARKVGRDWWVDSKEVARYRAEQLGQKGRKRISVRRKP